MTIVNADDKNLIDYIDTQLDNLNIKYKKYWQAKYNSNTVFDFKPIGCKNFIIIYHFDNFKAMRYKDKITQEFLDTREYLEKCFSL